VVAVLKGLILAGGLGTRLYPTTKVVNKHLLLVYDKPMIMYAINALWDAGITDIVLSLNNDKPGSFMELLGNGEELGVHLSYVVHGDPKGISYGINHARFLLGDEPFLCLLGDNIFGASLLPYVKMFRENPRESLILLKKCNMKEASRYGVAIFKDKDLVQLVEKPQGLTGDSAYALLGAYFFTPKFFEIFPFLKSSERGEYEVTDAINALMPTVRYEIYEGAWFDCGTFDSILEAATFIEVATKEKSK